MQITKLNKIDDYFAYEGHFIRLLNQAFQNEEKFQLFRNDTNLGKKFLKEIETIISLMSREDIQLHFNFEDFKYNEDKNEITLLPTDKFLNTNKKILSEQIENCPLNEAFVNI